ncbi:MAG: adenylate/guanylate cyclase domain-containing protein [Balneolaceae bacterium]
MIEEAQMPSKYREVIDKQVKIFKEGSTVQDRTKIPDTKDIPIENPKHWLKIPDVICLFVDMKGSTKLSASNYDKSTAAAFQLFTRTAVRLFDKFESPYIDIKGDGVMALFNHDEPYKAVAAAITFRTFANNVYTPIIQKKTDLEIKSHIGIDQKTVLVRKIGLKKHDGRTDRQNELWAGKPVNMASKLASHSNGEEILVSDRFFKNIKNDLVLKSCGCPEGSVESLWKEVDLSKDDKFDFNSAYSCKSFWCAEHGEQYFDSILKLDS